MQIAWRVPPGGRQMVVSGATARRTRALQLRSAEHQASKLAASIIGAQIYVSLRGPEPEATERACPVLVEPPAVTPTGWCASIMQTGVTFRNVVNPAKRSARGFVPSWFSSAGSGPLPDLPPSSTPDREPQLLQHLRPRAEHRASARATLAARAHARRLPRTVQLPPAINNLATCKQLWRGSHRPRRGGLDPAENYGIPGLGHLHRQRCPVVRRGLAATGDLACHRGPSSEAFGYMETNPKAVGTAPGGQGSSSRGANLPWGTTGSSPRTSRCIVEAPPAPQRRGPETPAGPAGGTAAVGAG
jgi:hypothetical protein